jgi:hypothetical protein
MQAMFEGDLAASTLVTLEAWEGRALGDRAREASPHGCGKYWL